MNAREIVDWVDRNGEEAAAILVASRLAGATEAALILLQGARGGLQLLTPEQFNRFTAALKALDELLTALR